MVKSLATLKPNVGSVASLSDNIIPLQLHFELNDLVFFYKIVYDLIPVSLPSYISPYNGESRLRSTRMDEISYAVNDNTVIPLDTGHSNSKFFKSFFYRTMRSWNSLPLDIRKSCTLVKFKLEVENFLWNKLLSNNSLEMGWAWGISYSYIFWIANMFTFISVERKFTILNLKCETM